VKSVINDQKCLIYLVTTAQQNDRRGFILTWLTPASLVQSQPRLLMVVSKFNFSLPLLEQTRKCIIHQLSQDQYSEFFDFGYYTSHNHDKFAGLDLIETPYGPELAGCHAILHCEVEDIFETPDRKLLYCRVIREHCLGGQALRLDQALARLSEHQRESLERKMQNDSQRDQNLLGLNPNS
jgi:flavin reductase (DIM6/NTAB) family NADH-FMN oxidoreductase RutF